MTDLPDTKTRIKEEALKLFVERGFEQAAVRDIAAAVGMNSSNLYSHFASKQSLLQAILVDTYTEYGTRIAAVLQKHTSFNERIEELVALVCRLHDENPLRFEFQLVYGQPRYTAGIDGRYKPANILMKAIQDAIAQHEIVPLNPIGATSVLIGGLRENSNFVRAGLIDHLQLNYAELVATCHRLLPSVVPDPQPLL